MIGGAAPVHAAVALPAQTEPQAGVPFLARRELGIVNVGAGAGRVHVDRETHFTGPAAMGCTCRWAREDVVVRIGRRRAAREVLSRVDACACALRDGQDLDRRRRAIEARCGRHVERADDLPVHRPADLQVGAAAARVDDRSRRAAYGTRCPRTCTIAGPRSTSTSGSASDDRVFHFMGEPEKMRHIVVANDEAVISPPWSIHMGAGTRSYSFIWAMGGENLDYTDMKRARPLPTEMTPRGFVIRPRPAHGGRDGREHRTRPGARVGARGGGRGHRRGRPHARQTRPRESVAALGRRFAFIEADLNDPATSGAIVASVLRALRQDRHPRQQRRHHSPQRRARTSTRPIGTT